MKCLSYHTVPCMMCFRLFHVDDIPSGVGGDALDFNKATAVSCSLAVRVVQFKQ